MILNRVIIGANFHLLFKEYFYLTILPSDTNFSIVKKILCDTSHKLNKHQ